MNKILQGTVRVITIDHNAIKEPSWIVFKRNNNIYEATPTESKGEFLIKHITERSEWRYIAPNAPGREQYDRFQKVFIEHVEGGEIFNVELIWSEWQLALNLLKDKKVQFDFASSIFDKDLKATIIAILE